MCAGIGVPLNPGWVCSEPDSLSTRIGFTLNSNSWCSCARWSRNRVRRASVQLCVSRCEGIQFSRQNPILVAEPNSRCRCARELESLSTRVGFPLNLIPSQSGSDSLSTRILGVQLCALITEPGSPRQYVCEREKERERERENVCVREGCTESSSLGTP